MTAYAMERAWLPENGKHYGTVLLTPKLDSFHRENVYQWGVLEAADLTYTTTIDLLKIVGDRSWHPRFDLMNAQLDWHQALGGNGGTTALSGIHAVRSKLHIKHLEVIGLPGCGLYAADCQSIVVDSAYFDRVGWPIYCETSFPNKGVKLGRIASRDHWWGWAWGNPGSSVYQPVSMRSLSDKVGSRGELVCTGMGWVIDGYTQMGDGIGFKVSGSRWRLRNAQVQTGFFNGVVPDNVKNPAYADAKFQFMKETVDVLAEDCVFGDGAFAKQSAPAALYVSFPFAPDPLVLRRCVFVKNARPHAIQINWAHVVADDCDFIGWGSWGEVFQLSPPASDGSMPNGSVDFSKSRIWAS